MVNPHPNERKREGAVLMFNEVIGQRCRGHAVVLPDPKALRALFRSAQARAWIANHRVVPAPKVVADIPAALIGATHCICEELPDAQEVVVLLRQFDRAAPKRVAAANIWITNYCDICLDLRPQ